MNLKELKTLLENQNSTMNIFHSVLQKKKNAIIDNDYNAMESVLKDEQTILQRIDSEDKKLKSFLSSYDIQNKLTIEKMLDDLKSNNKITIGDYKVLMALRNELKTTASKVVLLNGLISQLVDVSRSIIKETLIAIVGNKRKTLVNKRV
ncbi:MAG: flagellar export chaperone FlgN [Ignavibacteriaceae bacterium]|jgi:DNA primase large subunit|nr:flagellar export chaperone FlgN [Ignavibacteriaceae bacterium]